MKFYSFIAIISWYIRNYCMDNPFNKFFELLISDIGFIGNSSAIVLIIDFFVGNAILHSVTFMVVGFVYSRGEFPTLGSILYLMFYILHIYILGKLCVLITSSILIILLFIAFVFIEFIVLNTIRNKLFSA